MVVRARKFGGAAWASHPCTFTAMGIFYQPYYTRFITHFVTWPHEALIHKMARVVKHLTGCSHLISNRHNRNF